MSDKYNQKSGTSGKRAKLKHTGSKPESDRRKFSLFKNSYATEPEECLTFDEFFEKIKSGYWKKPVEKLRGTTDEKQRARIKKALPAASMSANLTCRDQSILLAKRLNGHSGLIVLDIDGKDNPDLNIETIVDRECLMQWVSCSGKGIKIAYLCKSTKDAAEHRRLYDAAVGRLKKKGMSVKVDPLVKSIASLQYVSYDKEAYYNPKSKLVIQPLPPVKIKQTKPSEDQQKELDKLNEYITALGDRDITKEYEDWLHIAFGLTHTFRDAGREPFHRISRNYPGYSEEEANEFFDDILERDVSTIETPRTIGSVYEIINENIPKPQLRQLHKKYHNGRKAIGIDDGNEYDDLAGMASYKLFLFQKLIEDETGELRDLQVYDINWNALVSLLNEMGFRRHESSYVRIVENIVEPVDTKDILRMVTQRIKDDGDYRFNY